MRPWGSLPGTVEAVIGRRLLLLGGAAALAGCTGDGNPPRLPWSPPSPLPVTMPDGLAGRLGRTSALAGLLVGSAAAWKLTATRVRTLEWFRTATLEHLLVLTSADPARRQRAGVMPTEPTAPVLRTAAATQSALSRELLALQGVHRASARTATGPAALLWASLAAFSATMAAVLPHGVGALGDDGTDRTPDLTATDVHRVLLMAAQAVYSYEMALAASGLTKADRGTLRSRLRQWQALRPMILSAAPEIELTAPSIGYDLRPARDRSMAWQIALHTESAALELLGAWIAGPATPAQRRIGVDALAATNVALVRFGGSALRWPGWPG